MNKNSSEYQIKIDSFFFFSKGMEHEKGALTQILI
jgi:hypothetical protein